LTSIWITGAIAPDEGARALIWGAALILDYGGPLAGFCAPGLKRTEATEWELEHGHFVERFELFVMIVLGESIVVTGATASQLHLRAARSAALVVAFLGIAVFFWLYFDEVADRAAHDCPAPAPSADGSRATRSPTCTFRSSPACS